MDQNLSILLNEIAQLNRDKTRLITAMSDSPKLVSGHKIKIKTLEKTLRKITAVTA